ncbi:hypothetical protein ACFFJY_12625 [Fictibacillus aquaticus]|uniref:Serine aminopeptidase S33 domain-containing protein n=1 Tax=Fictibacillus aquaticus TaxID=2021314 RepID=A0A235FDS7_9BACL|nr:hypothetical protein [Fictibacillus aquaticus]OYD59084.1 hypothetical protein CGZ90_04055 [Fictibacillus aquaticus]
MAISKRFFQMDNQWNVIHLPERPSGFALIILGDANHFVEKGTCLWTQSQDRKAFLDYLIRKGYTVFYSNHYGRHWGSPKAVTLAKRFHHYIMKHEILNPKIHIIGEGMGGLVALSLMEEMEESIRSCVLLNPCLQLKSHFIKEKENRLFFKRMVREISASYSIHAEGVETMLEKLKPLCSHNALVPVKIWHAASGCPYHFNDHSRVYEKCRLEKNAAIELTLHLPEHKGEDYSWIGEFLKRHEAEL